MTAQTRNIDAMLEHTFQRPRSVRPPSKATNPIGFSLRGWASSQVAAYRVGLLLGYAAMMYFGAAAFVAGIPTFTFTTPEGWTPVWSAAVVVGGLIASVGSLRAGKEPQTKEIRLFNRIELVGAVLLFLTLGTYSATLLYIGYAFHDPGRASVGAGFVALGITPAVRMIWLIFRPSILHFAHIFTVPPGYVLLPLDENGRVIPETPEQTTARLGLKE